MATLKIDGRETGARAGGVPLHEQWQEFWFWASNRGSLAVVAGFGVLSDLFGCLEIHFVNGILVEFAVVGQVIAADLRTRVVDAASMIGLQVFASGMDEEVPDVVLDKHGGAIVEQVPSHEVEILFATGLFDGEGKVTAAFCRAVIAEALAGRNLIAFGNAAIDGFGRCEDEFAKGGGRHGGLAIVRIGKLDYDAGGDWFRRMAR